MRSIFIIAIALVACSNPKQQTAGKVEITDSNSSAQNSNTGNSTAGNSTGPIDTTVTGCYSQLNNRDTATIQLDAKGITITGPLNYNYFEKDRNEGTFTGEVSGKMLTGWYLFTSEGMVSVRQTIFKIENGQLLPGVGSMKERNDSMVFSNPDALSYDSGRPFKKVACVL